MAKHKPSDEPTRPLPPGFKTDAEADAALREYKGYSLEEWRRAQEPAPAVEHAQVAMAAQPGPQPDHDDKG